MPIGLLILLVLIGVPLLEIFVLIEVGSEIGAIPTIGLTVLTALAGTLMLRVQGLSLLTRMRSEIDAGRVPGDDIIHGAFIVIAAILLLIPGFVTDTLGLLLFIPPVRTAIGRYIIRHADVTVVQGARRYRRDPDIVDLDEEDWTAKNGDTRANQGAGGDPRRISPWKNRPDT
ncbi:FxsA family protein [Rhizobiales bacterium]|uniref:FxsA family protein n=1 Tax=Hongsoonwoonella zoysiae TaxID=2821844 RepID=UPI0015604BC0|nr:FxsA family protein [Hongsoonwoonella zoysiae]NRG16774.1 FxsA family protein [Hongsoonwoonella zoysiae]